MHNIKIEFRDYPNGSWQDWSEYLVHPPNISKKIESEIEGEAGVIVYDDADISLRYVDDVYNYFSINLSSKNRYLFRISLRKSNGTFEQLFEGVADFSTITWDEFKSVIKFQLVDKISALALLQEKQPRTFKSLKTENPPWLTPLNYAAGHYYKITIEPTGGTYQETAITIIKNVGNGEIHVDVGDVVPVFEAGDILKVYSPTDEYLAFITERWLWDGAYPPENDTWVSTATDSDDIYGTYRIDNTDNNAYKVDEPAKKLVYANDVFYTGDICDTIYTTHNGVPSKKVVSIKGEKILGLLVKQVWPDIDIVKRGFNSFPIPYHYWKQTIYSDVFNSDPLTALIKLADTMQVYVFIDKYGNLVLQHKSYLNYVPRSISTTKIISGINEKFFWNKLVDGVKVTAKSWVFDEVSKTFLEGVSEVTKTATGFTASEKIKPKNQLNKEILVADENVNTTELLNLYAYNKANGIISFYGKRHSSFQMDLDLDDNSINFDLIDNLTINNKTTFLTKIDYNLVNRSISLEAVEIEGYDYDFNQVVFPSPNSQSTSSTPSSGTTSSGGLVTYLFGIPLINNNGTVSLLKSDNFKLTTDNKLDTVQNIKTTSFIQFARIGINGLPDSSDTNPFVSKIYGNQKVTGSVTIDGDIYIGGNINHLNVVDLDVTDHVIRLNKDGDNTTAVNGGIELLGTSNSPVATLKYDGGGWVSNLNFDLASGKVYKIGTNEVLSSTTLGSTVLYSSLVQVGSLNHSLNINSGFVYKINNVEVLSSTTLGAQVVNSSLTKVGVLTQGTWNATPLADAYIASATNWNDAYAKRHTHSNLSILDATSASFTTSLKANYDTAYSLAHSHSNISFLNSINQNLSTSSSPQFYDLTLTNGEISTSNTNNLVLNPAGKNVVPKQTFDINLGTNTLKFLSIFGAELTVSQLVSQNTIATIGGRILVGRSTTLIADVNTYQTTIDVKHNNLNNGDRIYLEANGNVEFMAIISSATTITGGYRYSVTRNLDSTGANNWYSGDAVFNTGTIGDGFIDLYSIRGVKSSSQVGPTIVGNVRNSATYNDWSEHWAIGNLNGLYGYNSNVYGVGIGAYNNNTSHLLVDATNGIRIRKGATTLAQWDASGNILIGEVGTGKSNVYITSGTVQLRNNITALITLNADGTASLSGNFTSSGTISGATIISNDITGAYAKIYRIQQAANVYNGTFELGYNSSAIKRIYTDGVYGPAGSFSQVYNELMAITNSYTKELTFVNVNNGQYTYNLEEITFRTSTNPGVVLDKFKIYNYYEVKFNKILFGSNGTNHDVNLYRGAQDILRTDDIIDALGYKVNGIALSTTHLAPLTASKIAITDANGYLTASSIGSSELFEPTYAIMRHINNITTILSDVSWERYTGFTSDGAKNCTISNSSITVNNAGKYLISYSVTYRPSTNTGNTIIFDTFINNANSNYEIGKRSTLVRDTANENINCTYIITLTANSTIDLRMYSSDIDTITIVYATLTAIKISN